MSIALLEISFTGTGLSEPVALSGDFNLSANFSDGSGVGTVELQRQLTEGGPFQPTDILSSDTEVNGLAAGNRLWKFNCTDFTSGTIVCILEQ